MFILGLILSEQSNPDCVAAYEEAIQHMQRIQDTAAEAIAHFNLGNAYKDIPAIRNLDAAEAAYRRVLPLQNPNDAAGQSATSMHIGMVNHARFEESRQRDESAETLLKHAQAAEQHYLQALALCPSTDLTHLAPVHYQLARLCVDFGQTEPAREHFEKAVHYFEQTSDHYSAGLSRHGMAVMYFQAAEREAAPSRQRDLLHRAQAYAQAALRDFQHFQGRAAADEAKAQQGLAAIAQALTKLP
jgi:tetratricopeptide (TPR) repeat protein